MTEPIRDLLAVPGVSGNPKDSGDAVTHPNPDPLAGLIDSIERGDLDGLLDALDPDRLIDKLKDLDGKTRAVKVLLKAANARRRWRTRRTFASHGGR